jgi:Holliday junction resolvase RusA-like endonuclease
MMLHLFTIPIAPKSLQYGGKRLQVVAGRPRFFKEKKSADYQAEIAFRARKHAPKEPHTGALILSLDFFLPRPKSARKTAQAVKRPDLDNLVKGTQDALKAFWKDDAQIVSLHARKFLASSDEPARIIVRISSSEDC